MTNDRFFRGFLAALRETGDEFLVTKDDAHHKKFKAVASLLGQFPEDVQDELPAFIPSPFTGRFRELEDAILQMQRGLLGAQNPFYPCVNLDVSKERATAILGQYTRQEQDLFRQLARAYKERQPADVTVGEEARGARP